jgi:RNA-directed DNA polymerase
MLLSPVRLVFEPVRARRAVCKRALSTLADFAWWRVAQWLITLHRWTWKDLRRHYTDRSGRWRPLSAGEVRLFDIGSVPVRRYRYRGQSIPLPWTQPHHA